MFIALVDVRKTVTKTAGIQCFCFSSTCYVTVRSELADNVCHAAPKTTTTTTTVPLSVTSLLTGVTNSTITGSHSVEADADLITSISIPTPAVTVADTGECKIQSNTKICLTSGLHYPLFTPVGQRLLVY